MERQLVAEQPQVGTIVAFKPDASKKLADIPGTINRVVARLADGDYLVSLKYSEPVRFGAHLVTGIDALASDLYQPS